MARCARCGAELSIAGVCAVCSAGSEPTMVLTAEASEETIVLLPSSDGAQTSPRRSSSGLHTSSSSAPPKSGSEQQMAPGTVLASRYRIVAPIGRGGMGQVYRAEDLKLGETVALKFLPRSLAQDAAWLGRFFMEVRTAREVTHPNVCRVHDVVETQDGAGNPLYFLTMEYVDGENLADLVRRFGRLPTEKGMEIAGQITAALAAAHEKGVLHRDIKPANVLIDGRGQAKLADFGLAVASHAAHAAEIAGTPGYIAPEIVRGGQATGRSDLYSLGLVLYELLTGKRAVKDGQVTGRHVREHAPEVTAEADKAVYDCMQVEAAKRPGSAMDVLRAFPAKNALEAALARGETPSPEMVADSADEQPMALWKAWALVGTIVLGLCFVWFAAGHGGYLSVKPPQLSPDEMQGRAQQFLRDYGYPSKGTAQRFTMSGNYPLLDWYSENGTPQQKRDFKNSPQGSIISSYQQSPNESILPPDGIGFDSQGEAAIPAPTLGEGSVQAARFDSDGDLIQFFANPSNVQPTEGPIDWSGVLKASGLDSRSIKPAAANFTPPFAADEMHTWTGWYPAHPEFPMRVYAASWRNKLNFARVAGVWDPPLEPQGKTADGMHRPNGGFRWADATQIAQGLAIFVSILLAIYNLREKKGDIKSATKLALFLLFLGIPSFLAEVQPAGRSSTDYLQAFLAYLAGMLLVAAFLWMVYIAVEPLTRKRMPELLVGSSLILQDRWKSVRVGREVLFGCAVGVFMELWYQSAHALQWGRWPGATLDVFATGGLRSFRAFLGQIFGTLNGAFIVMAGVIVIFTFLLVIFRNRWIAVLWLAVFSFLQGDTRGSLLTALMVLSGLAIGQAFLILRVGIVAAVVSVFVSNLTDSCGWPHDWSSWMVPQMVWVGIVVLGVTGFGFWLAIGGQKPFGNFKLEE